MENTNNLTDKVGKEASKETFNYISDLIEKFLSMCGGAALGYGVDISLGGDGWYGMTSGTLTGLLISVEKEYIEKLSKYLAKGIIKVYINSDTQYKNKKI